MTENTTSAVELPVPSADEAAEPISIRRLDRLEATTPPGLGVKLN
jgi:hypothetical protein